MRARILAVLLAATTTLASAQSDTEFQFATAQKGEGIYSLLRRSGYAPSAALTSEFKKINFDKLSGGNGLKLNIRYQLPGRFTIERHSIFGESYQDVEIKNTTLHNHVY